MEALLAVQQRNERVFFGRKPAGPTCKISTGFA
jgi:hypothetical protein